MKKKGLYCLLAVFCLLVWSSLWALDKDISDIPACKYCGMNRESYAHSRMVIDFSDETTVGTCSLTCTAVSLTVNPDKSPKTIRVADYGTKELINAKTAFWIIGGTKPGVMTKHAKWAFAKKEDAEKFQKEKGGRLAMYDQVLETANREYATKIIIKRERKKEKDKLNMMDMKH